MKKYWLILFTCIIFNNCSAQKSNELLKNITYYTTASNKWTSEIKLTEDSLFMLKNKGRDVEDKQQYEIVGEEKRDMYFFVYVKIKEKPIVLKIPSQVNAQIKPRAPHFDVFVLYFSKDKETLFLLSEPITYKTMEEAKTAYSSVQLEDKYFTIWYSESKFTPFTHYPDIANADKATIQKVTDEWLSDLTQNANKMRHTRNIPMQENLSKALINNHLNPLGDMTDFNNKLTEYHIALPKTIN